MIEEGKGEYYGVSWFGDSPEIVLSHSNRQTNEFADFKDLVYSEIGVLSHGVRQSPRFLSQPHQILCLDSEHVLATNTGRNQLAAVNVRDWSVRQLWLSEELWDRDEHFARVGAHVNSIDFVDGKIYVVEHNWERGATLAVVEWPSLTLLERRPIPARGAHNVWVRDNDYILVADTMRGALVEVVSGKTVWRSNDPQTLTRGLAATDGRLFVGSSQPASRGDRFSGPTGIWVVDLNDMKTLDYFWLGRFGAVHEIRVLDGPDFCHRKQRGLELTDYLRGLAPEDFWTEQKLAYGARRFLDDDVWDVHVAGMELLADGWMSTIDNDLTLATLRDVRGRDVNLKFEVDLRDPRAHQMDLVWRYRGPGDDNYCAVLFVRTPQGISVEACAKQGGEWTEFARAFWPALQGAVEVTARGDVVSVVCGDNEASLNATCGGLNEAAGGLGIRAVRGRVRKFRAETLD